jgi:soluble lytic murein transglycosylase
MISLFFAFVLAPNLFRTPTVQLENPPAWSTNTDTVPAEALRALKQGRYWRASKILRGYLAVAPDSSPESILLAARADAGWGDWIGVERLLAGRGWLDTADRGAGWDLLGQSRLARGQWAGGEHALSRYLAVAGAGDDRERGLAEARRGQALRHSDSPNEAVQAFQRAATLLPELGDWLSIFAADAAAHGGDTAMVSTLLDRTDTKLAEEWGWSIRVEALTRAGDLKRAQAVALAAANGLGDVRRRTEAWLSVGNLRLQRGDSVGARDAYRRAIAAAPQTTAALGAARALSGLGSLTPDDQLRIGRLYLRHGNVDRGLTGLQGYLDAGAGNALERAAIQLEVGRALFNSGRYAEAEKHLLALADNAASARIGADALYLAARAQYRQGRVAVAQASLLRTAERFPREAAATAALYLMADLEHDASRIESAREYYRRAVAGRPGVSEGGLAQMRLGGLAFLERDYAGAARIFDDYRKREPKGSRLQQAAYWAGRAHDKLGNQAEAKSRFREVRRLDPFSWYGMRAAEFLGENFLAVRMEPAPPRNEAVVAEVEQAFTRLDLLRELGEPGAVDFEVDRLKDYFAESDGASYALAEAFNERGHTVTGIRLGWEIYRREGAWNPRLLRIVYPFPFQAMVMAEAREQGLDPFFVAGLIRQESTFSAAIRSPAGAIGLMQIMPATGKTLAGGAGVKDFGPDMLEKPELNLHLGMTYLSEMLRRYGGRVGPALAAYNAGPQRLTFWSTFPEYDDDELFAERIPFAETRGYVKIVQQNARIYAALYTDTGPLGTTGE